MKGYDERKVPENVENDPKMPKLEKKELRKRCGVGTTKIWR